VRTSRYCHLPELLYCPASAGTSCGVADAAVCWSRAGLLRALAQAGLARWAGAWPCLGAALRAGGGEG
jgi:hypothetical protein